ncbi:hypothetical protein EZS27_026957, partial [termite gut metagenome]
MSAWKLSINLNFRRTQVQRNKSNLEICPLSNLMDGFLGKKLYAPKAANRLMMKFSGLLC